MAEKKNQARENEEVEEKDSSERADTTEVNEESADEKEKQEKTEEQAENGESIKYEEEIAALKKEKDDLFDRLLRVQAEYENFKKRTQKEREAERKYKAQDLVNDILPVLDNFERALQVEKTEETSSLIEGISMVHRQLLDALKNNGVEMIETEGKQFDPNLHHAVMQVEDESYESNQIVEELQKGYMLKDRVIRPAMVKVNK